MPVRGLVVCIVLAAAASLWLGNICRVPPPGIVAVEEPLQTEQTTGAGWRVGSGTDYATALAGYRIHARVLGIERYRYDRPSRDAPVDLALGWGKMSDSAVYRPLNISQRGRFYLYGWGREGPPIAASEIATHSANTHVIPADDEVARALLEVRVHDVVWMEGDLVEVNGPDGFHWRSSLTRTDTGNGACEVFRVTNLVIEPAHSP